MKAPLLGLALALAAAAPAVATTIPPLDLAPGQTGFAVGTIPWNGVAAVDASFDRGFAPGLAAGATLFHLVGTGLKPGKTLIAGRVAWMPAGWGGLVTSLGGGNSPWGDDVLEGFLHLGGAIRAGLGPLTFRLTFGPAIVLMARTAPYAGGIRYFDPTPSDGMASLAIIPLVPNAELAWRVWAGHELVVGGDALAGYRARF